MDKSSGFAIAAAFWGGSGHEFPDPEIGELKFVLKSWGGTTGDLVFTDLKQ